MQFILYGKFSFYVFFNLVTTVHNSSLLNIQISHYFIATDILKLGLVNVDVHLLI